MKECRIKWYNTLSNETRYGKWNHISYEDGLNIEVKRLNSVYPTIIHSVEYRDKPIELPTMERLEELAGISDDYYAGKEVNVLKDPESKLRGIVVLDGQHAEGAARGVRNLAKIQLEFMKLERVK